MSKQGSVAPPERVNITYQAGTGDAQQQVELPNKMLMIGDYTLREEEEELQSRSPVNINQHNFNEVMKGQNLQLTISVPNRLVPEDEELTTNLNFTSIRSFEPEEIVAQVPELKKLLELRDALAFLKGPLGNVPAFRKELENLVTDSSKREALLKELTERTEQATDPE